MACTTLPSKIISSDDEEITININEKYAENYDDMRHQEEYLKCKLTILAPAAGKFSRDL